MNDETLHELWDAEVMDTPEARGSCPSPDELLDAVEGHRRGAVRDEVLLHLSRCTTCRAEARIARALLAAGARKGAGGAEGKMRGVGAAPARKQGVPGRNRSRSRSWGTLSAAASVILVAGGAGALWWALGGDASAVRGGDDVLGAPVVTCSAPGSAVIQWARVDDARDYRVEIFKDDGTVLAERVVAGPEGAVAVALGADMAPAFGPDAGPVLARVEARFEDSRATGSPTSRLPSECRPAP